MLLAMIAPKFQLPIACIWEELLIAISGTTKSGNNRGSFFRTEVVEIRTEPTQIADRLTVGKYTLNRMLGLWH